MNNWKLKSTSNKIEKDTHTYKNTVKNFIDEWNWKIIFLSKDTSFSYLLQNLRSQAWIQSKEFVKSLWQLDNLQDLLENEKYSKWGWYMFFLEIEELLYEEEAKLLYDIQQKVWNLHTIILVSDSDNFTKNKISHCTEYWFKSFIVKPISINNLLKKMHYQLNPLDSKTSKLIDFVQEKIHSVLQQEDKPNKKNVEEISKMINTLKTKMQKSTKVFILEWDMYLAIKDYENAHICYKKAVDSAPDWIFTWEKLAKLAKQMWDTKSLIYYMEQMDKINPFNIQRKIDIISSYWENLDEDCQEKIDQKSEDAVKMCKKTIKLKEMKRIKTESQQRISTIYQRIWDTLKEHLPETSREYYDKAIQIKWKKATSEDISRLNELWKHLRKIWKHKEAIDVYQQALSLDKNNQFICYNIARAYLDLNNYTLAYKYLSELLKINHDFLYKVEEVNVLLTIWYVFLQNKDKEMAKYVLQIASEKDPQNKKVQKYLNQI